MRVYTEFEWTEKHMFQSERLRTLIQIVRQAFLCRNTRRKDCESRESPEQWRYPVVLPLRNSVVGKGRLLALLAVLHGVRKEDPFSGTGLNFRLFFLPGGDGVLVKNGKLRCGKRKRTLVTLAGSNRAEDATFPKSKAFSAKTSVGSRLRFC